MSELLELYKKDPADLNTQCRDRWKAWFDSKFKSRIKENLELYNNYSQILADRKNDEVGPVRACLFIPVINPAVLARAGWMRQQTFTVPEPIEVDPEDEQDEQSVANLSNVKLTVNSYLTTEEFKTLYLQKLLIQEIYPIGFYFISEYEEEKKSLSIEPENSEVAPQVNIEIGKTKKWKTQKKQWRPKVDIYTQENIAYDPYATRWDKDNVTYVMKICHLTLGELVSRKNPPFSYEFDIQELKDKGEKANQQEKQTKTDDQSSIQPGGLTQRYVVLENWVKIENEKDEIETHIITSCGKIKLKDRLFPYETLDITDIFIPFIGYPVLNQIEGMNTTDLLKYPQHAINDAFNMRYDADSYGNFPPSLKDSRATIVGEGRMGPSSIKDIDMRSMPPGSKISDVMQQLYQISPSGPETLSLLNLLFERCEITARVPQDMVSRISGNPNETATKTQYRAQGASGGIAGINLLSHVEEFRRLCNTLYYMTLERLQIGEDLKIAGKNLTIQDLLGQFKFDMPYLSGLLERQEKERKFTEFMVMTQQEPIMQLPQVRYEFLKELARFKEIDDFEKKVPSQLIKLMTKLQAQAQLNQNPGIIQGGQGQTQLTPKVGVM